MNRVLLDTDVILDLILEREPFVEDVVTLWNMHNTGKISAFISGITPVNVYYIARKSKGHSVALQAVNDLIANVSSA